ncbi:MAG: toxin-antitoxin system YwqK family antitoxin [Chitinophagia bacterium]|jgi:antitoxin component YwqK of YwqJK toxin-antitoxin module
MKIIFYSIIIITCIFFQACNPVSKKMDVNSSSTPNLIISSQDRFLQMHQDTLFFHATKFSGTIFNTYPNGDTSMIGHYLNGLEEGAFKKWYPNHQLLEWRIFHLGKKVSKHLGFWEDGKPRFEFYFTQGEHDGEANEWYANGQAYKAFHYSMGFENGSQKMWWDNGVIRANYVVKQGKRYGLIGLKLCMTPKDSLDNTIK